jgi:PilZ domain-containing protein
MKPRYRDRIPLKCPVTFTTGSQTGEGRVLDVTSPGCLIQSAGIAVVKGQSLQLKMSLPGHKVPLMVALGVVRWTIGNQFGVEFIKMDEANRLILNRFMAQHLRDPRRTTKNSFSEPGGRNWHLETYSA